MKPSAKVTIGAGVCAASLLAAGLLWTTKTKQLSAPVVATTALPDQVPPGIVASPTTTPLAPTSRHNQPSASRQALPRVELSLTTPAGLNVPYISDVIAGDDYGELLAKLDAEASSDLEAREMTRIYGEQISSALQAVDPSTTLNKLACGISVCGLELSSASKSDTYFVSILNTGKNSGARIYSAITEVVPKRDGSLSYRMVFSTDPARNMLRVPTSSPGDSKLQTVPR